MIGSFSASRVPALVFGPGSRAQVAALAAARGRVALLVTPEPRGDWPSRLEPLAAALEGRGLRVHRLTVRGEPSPELVDGAAARLRPEGVGVVVAVGGGSVLDAGKAVAAMLGQSRPVADFLEDVGLGAVHDGTRAPLVCVPTTAGTGSEATRNAVLSRPGPGGFKKSLRHENFVPDVAVLDPELAVSCPPDVTAACGMDALTQLLESYVSPRASPLTDALALSGLRAVRAGLVRSCEDGADVEARGQMAWAAFASGVTLANAGLGVVHGLASALGGRFEIPHGVVCGTLVGACTAANVRALRERHGADHPALARYARAGALLQGLPEDGDVGRGCDALLETLERWTDRLALPRLGRFGMTQADVPALVGATAQKTNAVALEAAEVAAALGARI